MRLLIAVAALLLLSLTGPVPASAATPSLPSVDNDRPAPGGVQHHIHGETLTAQHHNSHDTVHNTTQHNSKLYPCPDEQDIAPCTCSVDDNSRLTLDCSAVISEEQLAAVFTAYFPVTDYYKFVIDQNDNIEQLGYILNEVTFQSVSLTYVTKLDAVSEEFLLYSSDTLETLLIEYSALSRGSFPFFTLRAYSQLQSLSIRYSSQLTSIPHLLSDTLTDISFDGCAISNIDPGTFDAVTQLQRLYLRSNNINSVQLGTFDALPTLKELHLDYNALTSLLPGTFPLNNSPQYLYLHHNQLTTIEHGAFVVPENTEQFSLLLDLANNALTVLEEEVLVALFPYITVFYVHGNPLACGCDVAWLVLNPEYMAKVGDENYVVTCADGRVFQDLDPAYYETLC